MGAKIVIVEDDQLMANLYKKVFSFEDYEVVLASDGQEGLDAVRKEKPDMVLLDMMMPKMNGMQVLEKLKDDDKTKDIPVLVLSNLAGDKDAEKAKELGAVDYLIKSDNEPKVVVETVKKVLS